MKGRDGSSLLNFEFEKSFEVTTEEDIDEEGLLLTGIYEVCVELVEAVLSFGVKGVLEFDDSVVKKFLMIKRLGIFELLKNKKKRTMDFFVQNYY